MVEQNMRAGHEKHLAEIFGASTEDIEGLAALMAMSCGGEDAAATRSINASMVKWMSERIGPSGAMSLEKVGFLTAEEAAKYPVRGELSH